MSNQLAELQMKLDDAINNRVKAENDWNHMFDFFFIFDCLKKILFEVKFSKFKVKIQRPNRHCLLAKLECKYGGKKIVYLEFEFFVMLFLK